VPPQVPRRARTSLHHSFRSPGTGFSPLMVGRLKKPIAVCASAAPVNDIVLSQKLGSDVLGLLEVPSAQSWSRCH